MNCKVPVLTAENDNIENDNIELIFLVSLSPLVSFYFDYINFGWLENGVQYECRFRKMIIQLKIWLEILLFPKSNAVIKIISVNIDLLASYNINNTRLYPDVIIFGLVCLGFMAYQPLLVI